jgi:FMN phosphatase YigB (HAD superfamily)
LAPAWAAIADPSVTHVTADVFDTLVFRTVRRPVEAFSALGRALSERGLLAARLPADDFQPLRRQAEKTARERLHAAAGVHEVTIREIYEAFPRWALAPDASLADLIETEVVVEREICVPDLEVSAVLLAAQEAGKQVALVSDNYLGAANLRAILSQPPLGGLDLSTVFCSCDYRTGKGGELWPIVLNELGVRPQQIAHIGDNAEDDVKRPGELGVRTILYSQRPPESEAVLDAERRLLPMANARPLPHDTRADSDFGLTALRGKVLGAAHDVPSGVRPYWDYGATVLGPVLTAFAAWVAQEARHMGFTGARCLMREGTFLTEMVRAADSTNDIGDLPPLDVRPLWLNRRTCMAAAVIHVSDEEVRRIYSGRTSLTLRQTLEILGLDLGDVPPIAGHADTHLDDETLQYMLRAQLAEPEVKAKVQAHARRQRDRVVRLLEDAATPDGGVLLVDVGWGASIQALANQCLAAAGSRIHTVGLYLMTHEGATERMVEGTEAYGFLADPAGPHELTSLIMRSPEILEQVVTTEVGSQIGLDGDLQPICEPLDERMIDQHRQARWTRTGIRAFQDLWSEYRTVLPGRLADLEGARPQLLAQLARALLLPTPAEATLFGDWHHDEGKGSPRLDELASADRLALVSHATPRQLRQSSMRDIYWPFGLAGRAAEHHGVLMAALATGILPWEATEAPLPIGMASLRGLEGHWGHDEDGAPRAAPTVSVTPTQNLSGNSLISLSLEAPDLQVIELQPGYMAHLLRVDWLTVRLWQQGDAEPHDIVLADADRSAAPLADGYVALAHNTFAAPGSRAAFVIDLRPFRQRVAFSVEVELGYSAMAMPAPLHEQLDPAIHGEVAARAERLIEDMKSSLSWRVTKPLRTAKRIARAR